VNESVVAGNKWGAKFVHGGCRAM